jgi:hypothetical protein
MIRSCQPWHPPRVLALAVGFILLDAALTVADAPPIDSGGE